MLPLPENSWVAFGVSAVIFAFCNVIFGFVLKKDPKYFRFFSLALTAVTVCAFLNDVSLWVHQLDRGDLGIAGDLIDVVIPGAKIFMTATLASILINVTTLIPWKGSKKK